MHIGAVVTIKVKEDKIAEFEAIFTEITAWVRTNEKDLLLAFYLTKSRTDPTTYKVLEVFANDEARIAHSKTTYLNSHADTVTPCLAGPLEVEYFDGVA